MMDEFINREGNQSIYDSANILKLENSMLEDKCVLFLGSSVTFGYASLEDAIPEYFRQRFGCKITKEAVSGTTLVDEGPDSYVNRLKTNIDTKSHYDLMICQLSTNDATLGKRLGEISDEVDADTIRSSSLELIQNSLDTTTIMGAMEYIIAYVRQTWNCPVFFYTGSRYESEAYQTMVERLYEIADKWKIGVLDLWSDDTFNQISEEERALYMVDPIHPTKAGYMVWWCPELERQILKKYK